MENEVYKKQDGFKDEQLFVIPTESFRTYLNHPMVSGLYLTDVGFFPSAAHHYKEREEGIEEYILLYCTGGKGVIELEHASYELQENQAFCIPRRKKHRYYAGRQDPWSILWVHFRGENTKYFPLEEHRVVRIHSRHAVNRMMFLFDLLFRVLERNYTLGNFIYISQVLSLILAEIYHREKGEETSKQNRHVTAIVRYMYKHIHENLTLDAIAEELGLSKSYINIIFKRYADRPPIDFFINLKMQEACKLLKSTDLYVWEIADKFGYEDQYYFSRIFKKMVGVPPKEYKNSEYFYYKD